MTRRMALVAALLLASGCGWSERTSIDMAVWSNDAQEVVYVVSKY